MELAVADLYGTRVVWGRHTDMKSGIVTGHQNDGRCIVFFDRLKKPIHVVVPPQELQKCIRSAKVLDKPTKNALEEMKIEWTEENSHFIRFLAESDIRVYLETCDHCAAAVEEKYFEVTGTYLLEGIQEYRVIPDDKRWGTKGAIYSTPFVVQQAPETLSNFWISGQIGAIHNLKLVWALIRLGFRVGDRQNTKSILSTITYQETLS